MTFSLPLMLVFRIRSTYWNWFSSKTRAYSEQRRAISPQNQHHSRVRELRSTMRRPMPRAARPRRRCAMQEAHHCGRRDGRSGEKGRADTRARSKKQRRAARKPSMRPRGALRGSALSRFSVISLPASSRPSPSVPCFPRTPLAEWLVLLIYSCCCCRRLAIFASPPLHTHHHHVLGPWWRRQAVVCFGYLALGPIHLLFRLLFILLFLVIAASHIINHHCELHFLLIPRSWWWWWWRWRPCGTLKAQADWRYVSAGCRCRCSGLVVCRRYRCVCDCRRRTTVLAVRRALPPRAVRGLHRPQEPVGGGRRATRVGQPVQGRSRRRSQRVSRAVRAVVALAAGAGRQGQAPAARQGARLLVCAARLPWLRLGTHRQRS